MAKEAKAAREANGLVILQRGEKNCLKKIRCKRSEPSRILYYIILYLYIKYITSWQGCCRRNDWQSNIDNIKILAGKFSCPLYLFSFILYPCFRFWTTYPQRTTELSLCQFLSHCFWQTRTVSNKIHSDNAMRSLWKEKLSNFFLTGSLNDKFGSARLSNSTSRL